MDWEQATQISYKKINWHFATNEYVIHILSHLEIVCVCLCAYCLYIKIRIFTKFNETSVISITVNCPRGATSHKLAQTIWNCQLVMLIKWLLSEATATTCLVTEQTHRLNSGIWSQCFLVKKKKRSKKQPNCFLCLGLFYFQTHFDILQTKLIRIEHVFHQMVGVV